MTPKIQTARYFQEYQIEVTFEDGKTGVIDLCNELWGEVFEPLKDIEQFKKFRIDNELATIVWPTGADLAPEFLYQSAA
ncbi:MAG: hypothetical protein ACI9ON_002003 [Limisphaerales bacterium]|jgi:hypothetical protein